MDNRYDPSREDQRALAHSHRQGATRRYAGQPWHDDGARDGDYDQQAYEDDRRERPGQQTDRNYRRDNRHYRQNEGYRNPEPGGFEQIMGSRRPPREAH